MMNETGGKSREEVADSRLQQALDASGSRDPRPYYREQLKLLKQHDETAYARGSDYYAGTLVPRICDESNDPLAEWLEYGRVLVSLRVPGETVQIDATGKSLPYARPPAPEALVLHLPTAMKEPAVAVGLPKELAPAQRAAYELLVKRRTSY